MATFKDSVRVATTEDISLSGTQTIDGVAVSAGPPGDRVLVKDQTNAAENGIYIVDSGSWTRASDADTSVLMTPESATRVSEGALNAHTEWALETPAPITLDTTSLTFAQQPTVADDIARSGGLSGPIDRVEGIRGRAIASTAPTDKQAYTWNAATSEWKPRKGVAIYHVDDYGAVADAVIATPGSGTDNSAAIMAAIEAAHGNGGGIVQFGWTGPDYAYRVADPGGVHVKRSVVLRGHGSSLNFPGTLVIAAPGVTALRFGGDDGGTGSPDSTIEDIAIWSEGALITETTGNFIPYNLTSPVETLPRVYELAVDDDQDFENGHLIAIEGAAYPNTLAYVEATVLDDSLNQATIVATPGFSDASTSFPWFTAGQYVIIPGAWDAPVKIVEPGGSSPVGTPGSPFTITLETDAAAPVTAAPVKFCPPFVTRIKSGAGRGPLSGAGTWIIDFVDMGDTAINPCRITHFASGIDVMARIRINRVSVGDGTHDFGRGAGIVMRGNVTSSPPSDCSMTQISATSIYGSQYGLLVFGHDANACTFNVMTWSIKHWAFCDLSLIANTMIGSHAYGYQAYLSRDFHGDVYINPYVEGEEFCSLGIYSVVVGGGIPLGNSTGYVLQGGRWNRMHVGVESYQGHSTAMSGVGGFWTLRTDASGATLSFGKSTTLIGPGTGVLLWTWDQGGKTRSYAITDVDHPDWRLGTPWMPDGFMLGDDSYYAFTNSWPVRLMATRGNDGSVPTDLDKGSVRRDPLHGPYETANQNFLYGAYNAATSTNNTPIWKKGDAVFDGNLLEGCPLQVVVEDGHRADEWKAGHSYAQYNIVCPTRANHNGRLYQKLTSDSQPSDSAEPVWGSTTLEDLVIDGDVTWTDVGAAALSQPVELDGFLEYTLADADATWAETDRRFLAGTVRLGGALTANRTITLPAGRYKRFFVNATTGGFSLTFQTAGAATPVTIANNRGAELGVDGANTYRRTADVIP